MEWNTTELRDNPNRGFLQVMGAFVNVNCTYVLNGEKYCELSMQLILLDQKACNSFQVCLIYFITYEFP